MSNATKWFRPIVRRSAIFSCTGISREESFERSAGPQRVERTDVCKLMICASSFRKYRSGALYKRQSGYEILFDRLNQDPYRSYFTECLFGLHSRSTNLSTKHSIINLGRRCYWYSPMVNSDKPILASNNNIPSWTAGQDVEVYFNSYWYACSKPAFKIFSVDAAVRGTG